MKHAPPVFPYWNLGICLLLICCVLLRSRNEAANSENERIANKAHTVRSSDVLAAGIVRELHPLIQEWDVNIPSEGSYEIALQYDNLVENHLFARDHRADLKSGKHVVRLVRDQLEENQVLRVSVDGSNVLTLPMKGDWQHDLFEHSIGNEVSQFRLKDKRDGKILILKEFCFFTIGGKSIENDHTGVLLFIALAESSQSNSP